MKKSISFILALVMMLALCFSAAAESFAGWWQIEDTGALLYLGEDGMMQMRAASVDGDVANFEFFCSVIEEEGATKLLPFSTAAEYRYVQRFAEREGWMDLTDHQRNTTSWLMVTPADDAYPGLEPQEEQPLVGVWSMMSEDLTAPCVDFYDDGYFAFEDHFALDDTEPLFGKYQLENGLLSLYPFDLGMTLLVELPGDGSLKLTDELGMTELVYTPYDASMLVPTSKTLLGTWENEESSITFHEDGTLDMAGITDCGTWSLNGLRLIISTDDPIWSFASYVTFVDGDTSVLSVQQADGTLSAEYTKK